MPVTACRRAVVVGRGKRSGTALRAPLSGVGRALGRRRVDVRRHGRRCGRSVCHPRVRGRRQAGGRGDTWERRRSVRTRGRGRRPGRVAGPVDGRAAWVSVGAPAVEDPGEDVSGTSVGVVVGAAGLIAGRGRGACGLFSTGSWGSSQKPMPSPATTSAEPTARCATRARCRDRTPDRRRCRCRGSKGRVPGCRASSATTPARSDPWPPLHPTGSMTSARIRRSRATPRDAWDRAVPTGHPNTSATCFSDRSW